MPRPPLTAPGVPAPLDVLKVRVYQEKIGLSYGDSVFLEPDPDSTIVISGSRSAAAAGEPVPDPAEV